VPKPDSVRTALQGAEKLALSEGYGLQAVHNCCVMNPALAAEGCYSSRNHTFSRSLFSRWGTLFKGFLRHDQGPGTRA
jgi:hypothetical protein